MLTVDEYFSQHAADAAPGELTDQFRQNAEDLLPRVIGLLNELGVTDPQQRSGWRPAATNAATANAASHSKHMTGNAIDVSDNDNSLDDQVSGYDTDNGGNSLLEKYGLYREAPQSTDTWIHLQNEPPGSHKRTFFP